MDLPFEWDPDKAASNAKKHGVTFSEAASVFADPSAVIFQDEEHSDDETRELIIGHSSRNRLLIISFTERPPAVRIISARKASKQERTDYEENAR